MTTVSELLNQLSVHATLFHGAAIVLLFILLYRIIVDCFICKPQNGWIDLLIEFPNSQILIETKMVQLSTEEFVVGTISPKTRKGNPAKVQDGTVSFSSSDENVFTVEQDAENQLKCKVTAKGEGVAQLDFSADADLGEGVKPVSGFSAVEVKSAEAAGFSIEFSAPEVQP